MQVVHQSLNQSASPQPSIRTQRFDLRCVPFRKQVSRLLRRIIFLPRRLGWWCYLRVCRTLSEVRSLFVRIGIQNEENFFVWMGPTWEESPIGHLVSCNWTRARISDTEQMRTMYPWATVVDERTFLAGWSMGAKWGVALPPGKIYFDIEQMDAKTLMCPPIQFTRSNDVGTKPPMLLPPPSQESPASSSECDKSYTKRSAKPRPLSNAKASLSKRS
jgi:hypothetical protein